MREAALADGAAWAERAQRPVAQDEECRLQPTASFAMDTPASTEERVDHRLVDGEVALLDVGPDVLHGEWVLLELLAEHLHRDPETKLVTQACENGLSGVTLEAHLSKGPSSAARPRRAATT